VQDPDPRILARARAGDLFAFEDLVRTYQADVFRFAWHLTRDRALAEDVTQEAFLRAFRFFRSYRGDSRFSSWLFRIARNCAMDAIRRQRTQAARVERERPLGTQIVDATARAELDAALRSVSDEHREPFLLIEVYGLSYQEAADVLGVRVGTVKSRMHRARAALMQALTGGDDVNCERVRSAISLRMDGERIAPARATAVQDHLATCPSCRGFAENANRLRRAVRIRPAEEIPDLSDQIMAAIAAERRPKRLVMRRAWASRSPVRWAPVAAALAVGLVAGSVVVGGPWQGPDAQRVAAADIVRGVRASARSLQGFEATFALSERDAPGTTLRSFSLSLAFAAPQRYRLDLSEMRDGSREASVQDLTFIADGTATYRSGPAPCATPVVPNPCIPTAAPVSVASSYAPSAQPPANLVVPIDVLGSPRGIHVVRTGTALGRPAVLVEVPFERAAPLFPFRSLGGAWPPVFPGDRTMVWLDRSRWFPLRATVYPSTDPDRQAWALRFGIPNTPTGEPIIDLVTTSIATSIPSPKDFVIPGGATPNVVPPSELRKEAGFLPVRPTFVAGLMPTSVVVPPGKAPDVVPQAVLTYSSGVTYLRVAERHRANAPTPFAALDPSAEEIRLSNGIAYYEPSTLDSGRRLTIHAGERDVVLESNLSRLELLQVASTLPIRGEPLPKRWVDARAGQDLARSVTLRRAREIAGFPITLPGMLPEGYTTAGVLLTRLGGQVGVTVTFRRMDSDLEGEPITLHLQASKALPPATASQLQRTRVGTVRGRWSPSVDGSQLEWVSEGLYHSLSLPGDDLDTALAIASSIPADPS
jgi:RNA polymerase sigma-70 factor (ECF subfamily)